jgi:hypothetical protein
VIQTLWIPGQLPGQNDIITEAKGYGGKGYGYARLKRQWTDTIVLLIKAERLQPIERARLGFSYSEKTKRRDPDNIAGGAHKLICDSLVTAGILPGDGWAHVAGFSDTWRVDKAHPGVLVTITSE